METTKSVAYESLPVTPKKKIKMDTRNTSSLLADEVCGSSMEVVLLVGVSIVKFSAMIV